MFSTRSFCQDVRPLILKSMLSIRFTHNCNYGVRCMGYGISTMVCLVWCMIFSVQIMMYDICCVEHGVW